MRRFAGFVIPDHCTRHLARSTARSTRHPAPKRGHPAAPSPNSICSNSSGWPTCRCHPTGSRLRWRASVWTASASGYNSQIWVVPSNGSSPPRPLTSGKRDTMPRWSADGTRLAFLRAIERDGQTDPPRSTRSICPAASTAAHEAERGRQRAFSWSPDARWLAVTSAVVPTPARGTRAAESQRRAGSSPAPRSAPTAPAIATAPGAAASSSCPSRTAPRPRWAGRFRRRPHRRGRSGLRARRSARCISRPHEVEETDFAPPKTLVFAAPDVGRRAAAKSRALTDPSTPLVPSPDGRALAFQGDANDTPVRSYSQPDLLRPLDWRTATVRNLTTAYDFDIGGGLVGRPARPARLAPARVRCGAPDGSSLLADRGRQGTRQHHSRMRGGRVDCAG